MSIEAFFDHKCDIYHIKEGEASPGFNLPSSPSFSHPKEPDIAEQACHFCVKARSVTVTQTAPANLLDAKIKLVLPAGTDVRLNDKIVDCADGMEYTAEKPVNVRGHHTFVYLKRTGGQQAL